MKKYFLAIMLTLALFLTGCKGTDGSKIKSNFIKNTNKINAYYMEGVLNLTNNEDTYQYDVEVSYAKNDYYKVVLTNKSNDYEQIILRNDEGVYVITPALNKSFKFQSNWPYNNSQSYLLHSIKDDIEKDENTDFEEKDGEYVFTTKVNYPNNKELTKQKVTIDKNMNLKKVEVLNKEGASLITFTTTSIDKKATFKDNYFEIDKNQEEIDKNCKEDDCKKDQDNKTTDNNEKITEDKPTIKETIFPLNLPENTTLSNKEVISLDDGERIIMTFSGDSPFILVEETAVKEKELTITPTYGEPFLLVDTVGSLTDISYTWTSNGIEYYIVSDVMSQNELLDVARSLNTVSTISTK